MIKIRIRNSGAETNIRFPIEEKALHEKLNEINIYDGDGTAPSSFVSEVFWPEEFSMLQDRYVNLDEMNYLGKRMDSFDTLEMDQFLIGITKLSDPTVKDLINLTFNLDHFTLVQDVSSYGKIGRAYVLNTEGCIPAHDEDDPKYVAIGKGLIDRGLSQITERGLLIYDPFDELTEVYDGHTFPLYYDRSDFLVAVQLGFDGKHELLLLPDDERAIEKAAVRLGASSVSECTADIETENPRAESMTGMFQRLIDSEGLCEVNRMLKNLDLQSVDWDKLSAVTEATGAVNVDDITRVADHLYGFSFIPKVSDEEDLAHYLVDNRYDYCMNTEMEDYFDFAGFGEYFAEKYDGKFVSGGFVFREDYEDVEMFLCHDDDEDEENDMTMGGI